MLVGNRVTVGLTLLYCATLMVRVGQSYKLGCVTAQTLTELAGVSVTTSTVLKVLRSLNEILSPIKRRS